MDRPEDVECHPHTGVVYIALTNNANRGTGTNPKADEANPRTANRDGHVVELVESGNDPTATSFGWRILLCAGSVQPEHLLRGLRQDEGLADLVPGQRRVRLAPATCGSPRTVSRARSRAQRRLAQGARCRARERGRVEQFLSVPADAETCGPVIHDDEGLVFVSVQHPGENGTWAAQRSFFPDYVPAGSQSGGRWVGHARRWCRSSRLDPGRRHQAGVPLKRGLRHFPTVATVGR